MCKKTIHSIEYLFSSYLSNLLDKEDKETILKYLEREAGFGITPTDRHFAIRASNGLKAYERIDVYVNHLGLIFIASTKEKESKK